MPPLENEPPPSEEELAPILLLEPGPAWSLPSSPSDVQAKNMNATTTKIVAVRKRSVFMVILLF
jgi:hypothetical protein